MDVPRVMFGKGIFYFGGNRGRGQVYPEGNQSNNNQRPRLLFCWDPTLACRIGHIRQ